MQLSLLLLLQPSDTHIHTPIARARPSADMVFLRLRVKVYPREQVAPTPSFSFRSILGDRDRDRDDASRGTNGSSGGKPVAFLLVLEKPEDITLGGLAGLIQDKWRKLRPNAE